MVHWPAKVKPGVSDQLVCTTDLFATLADILSAETEDHMAEDSFSFLSALGIPSNAPQRDAIVHHSINGSFALRKGDWKTIFSPGSGGWSAPRPNAEGIGDLPEVQLYNLISDVREQNNLQNQAPEIVEAHRELLSDYVKLLAQIEPETVQPARRWKFSCQKRSKKIKPVVDFHLINHEAN